MPDRVPVGPLRTAVKRYLREEGITPTQLALLCGYKRTNRHGNEVGDSTTFQRVLGIIDTPTHGGRRTPVGQQLIIPGLRTLYRYRAKTIGQKQAKRIAAVLGLDPVDLGF